MSILALTAAAAPAAAGENPYGLWQALSEGGVIAWSTFVILVGMSIFSFYILFTKLMQQQKIIAQGRKVRASFWNSPNLREAATKLEQRSAFLATVGSTAPFIGLFGTVIGIYRALIKIGASGQASIDVVAGPVGEALIMTALGLVVAVPAVLAYNWLVRRNKSIMEDLAAFTNDLHGYLMSEGRVKPRMGGAAPKTDGRTAATGGTARPQEPVRTGATQTGAQTADRV